ncbi:MAG TPA: hypothetical protein VNS32_05950 [Flavisolibacter sp.]|nr:hypothetical protein [Flavisolibacter sp.]
MLVQSLTKPDILIFKTNIEKDDQLLALDHILSAIKNISRWTVDRQDIDKVLRIVAHEVEPAQVIELLRQYGFYCEELPD